MKTTIRLEVEATDDLVLKIYAVMHGFFNQCLLVGWPASISASRAEEELSTDREAEEAEARRILGIDKPVSH